MKSGQISAFRKRVYEALCDVPRGRVTTYGRLAKLIGCGSARAVGGALRHNPFAPEVPCHRVIAFDGSIGGFGGCRQGSEIQRKIKLLRQEGVEFDASGHLCDWERLWP